VYPLLSSHLFLAVFFSPLINSRVALATILRWVHYPLLGRVSREAFVEYEEENIRRTGRVVIPVMAVELITALLLVWEPPAGILPRQAWLNLALLGGIWLSTFTLQLPYHGLLLKKFNHAVWLSLARTNWIRTAAWTSRGILLLFLLREVWAKGS